eukprot:457793-Alexandrium_andersonii.AAC.1
MGPLAGAQLMELQLGQLVTPGWRPTPRPSSGESAAGRGERMSAGASASARGTGARGRTGAVPRGG